jgi:hypothetical protein
MRNRRWLLGCVVMIGCVGDPPPTPSADVHLAEAGRWAWDASTGPLKPMQSAAAQAGVAGSVQAGSAADGGRFISLPRPAAATTTTTMMMTGTLPAAGDGGVSLDAAPPPSAAGLAGPSQAGELVITELMADPQAVTDAEGEWFELFNPTGAALELQRCEIDDGAKTTHPIEASLIIAPAAYVTFARSTQVGFSPDRVASFSLSNSADHLALRCGAVEIDRVDYDAAQGFPIVAGASASLDPSQLDGRANDAASAWCAARLSFGSDLGTPGRANPSCSSEADAGSGSD